MSVILRREVYLEFRCLWMGDHYPTSTEHASSERRTRGCDSNVPVLNYLVKHARVQPNRNPRNDERPADDINHTVLGFEDQNALTPQAHAILWHGIDADVHPPNYSSVSQSIAIPGSWGTRCGALGPNCLCRRVSVGLVVLVCPAVSEVLAAWGYLPWSTP
jgi:hypothetical protein